MIGGQSQKFAAFPSESRHLPPVIVYQHKMLIKLRRNGYQHKMLKLISSSQCRGARALLDMTQPQLASLADLGLSTVVDFERQRRTVSEEAVRKMQEALEMAGIVFIHENGGGAGVRLREKTRAQR
jgi:hypothetical protein